MPSFLKMLLGKREKMFDTHTHLNFKDFDPSTPLRTGGKVDQVIKEAQEAGVEKMIVVGTNVETSKKAVGLAQKYDCLYAAIGIHPHHIFEYVDSEIAASQTPRKDVIAKRLVKQSLEHDLKEIEQLLSNPKVIAVGEVGMDRHNYGNTKYPNYQVSKEFIDLQKQAFIAQIKLALKYKKSLVIHNREAAKETLEILEQNWDKNLEGRAVFHCCEADQRLLNFAVKYHIFIGIDGDVTYNKAKQEFVKKVPLELLVLETDSPFLVPAGLKFPNTPKNLNFIAEFIANNVRIDIEELKKVTLKNTLSLFKL